MTTFRLYVLAMMTLLWAGCSINSTPDINTVDLKHHFGDFDGCFVLLDVEKGTTIRYHPDRCKQRFSPCSTFKIPNSLIGLESGVIKDADHTFKWDGNKRDIESWNRDHTLRSAIRHSVVWYYQKLASMVGEEKMRDALAALDYGNQDMSGGLTRFWLGNTLKISADEQIEFLRQLYRGDLPFSQRSQEIVKQILILSEQDGCVLRGKTGSQWENGEYTLGWFVGYLACQDKTFIFATNISSANGKANGWRAREITEAILNELVRNDQSAAQSPSQ